MKTFNIFLFLVYGFDLSDLPKNFFIRNIVSCIALNRIVFLQLEAHPNQSEQHLLFSP